MPILTTFGLRADEVVETTQIGYELLALDSVPGTAVS